jgi:hypothetical protein
MHLHAAPMPDKETLQAPMYGPLVLAARLEEEPRERWYRHFTAAKEEPPSPTLQFKGNLNDPASWLEPAGGKLVFRTVSQNPAVTFVPVSSLLHERYSMFHEIIESKS